VGEPDDDDGPDLPPIEPPPAPRCRLGLSIQAKRIRFFCDGRCDKPGFRCEVVFARSPASGVIRVACMCVRQPVVAPVR
jgi:hypothetical protein